MFEMLKILSTISSTHFEHSAVNISIKFKFLFKIKCNKICCLYPLMSLKNLYI